MSGVTDNYGLILPAEGEPYDVKITNANNVEIDKQIKQQSNAREAQAKGYAAYAEMAANSGALTTIAVATFIPTFTFKANRRYRVGASGGGFMSDNTSTFTALISSCATTDANSLTTGLTQLKARSFRADVASEGREFLAMAKENYFFEADTTLQIKLTVARLNGAGTLTLASDATNRVCLYIEDLGDQF